MDTVTVRGTPPPPQLIPGQTYPGTRTLPPNREPGGGRDNRPVDPPPPPPGSTTDPDTGLPEVVVQGTRTPSVFGFLFPALAPLTPRALRRRAPLVRKALKAAKLSKLARANLLGVLAALMGKAIDELVQLSDQKILDMLVRWGYGSIDLGPPPPIPDLLTEPMEEVVIRAPRGGNRVATQTRAGRARRPLYIPGIKYPGDETETFGFPLEVPLPDPQLEPVRVALPAPRTFTFADPFAAPFGDPYASPGTRPVPFAPPRPGNPRRFGDPVRNPLSFPTPGLTGFREPSVGFDLQPQPQPLPPNQAGCNCPPPTKEKQKRKKRKPRTVCYRGTFYESSKSTRKYRKEKISCLRSKKK